MKRIVSVTLAISLLFSILSIPAFADDPERFGVEGNINIEKTVNTDAAEVDETLEYVIIITNMGPTTLTNIEIIDTFGGNVENIEVEQLPQGVVYTGNGQYAIDELRPYKAVTISYSYCLTAADVGTLENAVTVNAIPEGGAERDKVTADASISVTVSEKPALKISAINIEKSVDKNAAEVGDTLEFTLDVKNMGETELTDIVLTDIFSGNIENIQIMMLPTGISYTGNGVFKIGTLDRNASAIISYSYVASEADVGTMTNTVMAEAIPQGGGEEDKVTDEASSSPIIVTEKTVPNSSAIQIENSVDKETAEVGDTLKFTLDIKNTGETVLTAVKITDDFSGDIDRIEVDQLPRGVLYSADSLFEIAELDVNEVFTISYSYVVRSQDVGTLYNTAFAEGIPVGGTDQDKVFDEDSSAPVVIEEGTVPEEKDEEEKIVRPVGPRPQLLQKGDHLSYIIGYPDGNIYPLGSITRAEVATIFFRLLTDESRNYSWFQENPFSDVNASDWFNNAVSTMANAGILHGYPDGTFRPQAPVSRAEFVAIATRFTEAGRDGVSQKHFKQYFKDINQDDWYAAAVELAYELGWAQGFSGNYRPEDSMTRAEVMTMVNRIMEREVKDGDMLPDMIFWPDNHPDAWYYEAVQEATNSHTYQRTTKKVPNLTFCFETWMNLLENPDWCALEQAWSSANQ